MATGWRGRNRAAAEGDYSRASGSSPSGRTRGAASSSGRPTRRQRIPPRAVAARGAAASVRRAAAPPRTRARRHAGKGGRGRGRGERRSRRRGARARRCGRGRGDGASRHAAGREAGREAGPEAGREAGWSARRAWRRWRRRGKSSPGRGEGEGEGGGEGEGEGEVRVRVRQGGARRRARRFDMGAALCRLAAWCRSDDPRRAQPPLRRPAARLLLCRLGRRDSRLEAARPDAYQAACQAGEGGVIQGCRGGTRQSRGCERLAAAGPSSSS